MHSWCRRSQCPRVIFYYQTESGQQTAARDRLNASRRIKHPAYRQIALAPATGNREADQEQLLRRVRGWLSRQQ